MRVRAAVLMVGGRRERGSPAAEVSAPGPGDGRRGHRAPPAQWDLATLLDAEWEWRLRENPQFATTVGDHRYDDQLSKESIEDETRRSHDTQRFLDDVGRIDRAQLPPAEQVTLDMFRAELEDRLAAFRFREYLLPINADSGFHSGFALMPQTLRLEAAKDYDNYLARLRAFPRYMDEHIARMREGPEGRASRCRKVALAGCRHRRRAADARRSDGESALRAVPRDARRRFAAADRTPARDRWPHRRGRCRDARIRAVPRVPGERVHPRRSRHDRRERPARRRGLLPASREAVHHPAAHARSGARDRPRRGRAHPRRDGGR